MKDVKEFEKMLDEYVVSVFNKGISNLGILSKNKIKTNAEILDLKDKLINMYKKNRGE